MESQQHTVFKLLVVLCVTAVSCSGEPQLVLDLSHDTVQSDQCRLQFISQPPSTTLQSCNPYDQNEIIRIVLLCNVRRQSSVSDQFMIKWFRENTTGVVEDLGLGDPDIQQDIDQLSYYHNTEFFNQPYSPSLLGKYWCQVINTTADPDQPLMRSNVFTLLAPGNYSGPTCSSIPGLRYQVERNITCDLHKEQTTIPTPTSTMSSQISLSPTGIKF